MSEPREFDGYTWVADELIGAGPSVEAVTIYRNEAFAEAIGLAPDERDARAEFALIPAGRALIGLSDEDLERWEALNEESDGGLESARPQREVDVTEFLIARTTLTQEVWDGLAASLEMELWDQRVSESPFLPVHGLTWSFFVEVGPQLGLRLPTEVEWEYAASGGATRPFPWGTSKHSLFEYAWHATPQEGSPMSVAQKKPNAFGLYDISGNVWELCADHWHDNYYNAPVDQSAWLSDNDPLQRVMRGGSYRSETIAHLLCAFRSSAGIYFGGDDLGIRPVATQTAPRAEPL